MILQGNKFKLEVSKNYKLNFNSFEWNEIMFEDLYSCLRFNIS